MTSSTRADMTTTTEVNTLPTDNPLTQIASAIEATSQGINPSSIIEDIKAAFSLYEAFKNSKLDGEILTLIKSLL